MTPIYKKLKENGTSFYAFPGAAEDISAAYQNQNYKMYFSKYVLLNLPKQTLNPGSGTYSKPVYWDFENSAGLGYGFQRSNYGIGTYGDSMVESLRNYVANYEVTMKGSRKTNTEYYYDNTVLGTPTEKIFWKWCKKLNLIDFEPANNGDEYFGNLAEFERNNLNDDSYFPEILWKEREVIEWDAINFISGSGTQDRDGNMFEHKTYAVLADLLTKQGIAVLRVDDRGIGKSTLGPKPLELTSVEFAGDVNNSIQYLLSRNDINKNKIHIYKLTLFFKLSTN